MFPGFFIFSMLLIRSIAFLKPLTHAVYWWEGYGFIFLFFPIFAGPVRTLGALGFFMMHLGFGMCLRLGQFALVALFGLCSLFPTWFWEVNRISSFLNDRLLYLIDFEQKKDLDFDSIIIQVGSKALVSSILGYAFTRNLGIALENFFLIPETVVEVIEQREEYPMDKEKSDEYL